VTFGVEICDPQLDLVEFRDDGVSEINKIVGGWVGARPDFEDSLVADPFRLALSASRMLRTLLGRR
jgi:hypothetical protein